MRLSITLAGGLLFGLLATAQASQLTLDFTSFDSSRTDSAGNPVGPYSGTVQYGSGTPTAIQIFCDDLTHSIGVPSVYTENTETIANLAGARFTGLKGETTTQEINLYEQIFYLATYLPAASSSQYGAIQDAIWNLTYPLENNQGSPAAPTVTSSVQTWLNLAAANYAGGDYSGWVVMTDSKSQYSGTQELFYDSKPFTPGNPSPTSAAPEPASILSIAGGLGLLGWQGLRRRRS